MITCHQDNSHILHYTAWHNHNLFLCKFNHGHTFIHLYFVRDSYHLVIPLIYVSLYFTSVRYLFKRINCDIYSCHKFARWFQHVFTLQVIGDLITYCLKFRDKLLQLHMIHVSHLFYPPFLFSY